MADWVDVARVDDFPPGTVRTVEIEGTPIAVFNLNGHYYAIEDVCTHEAETLSDGEVEGEEIVCPRHGAHFSIVTGEALSPPAYEPVTTFPVQVEGGMVMVKDDRWG
jgi:3-phenylpropionate/trans-cinnamate dioxygenase ferredoxin component